MCTRVCPCVSMCVWFIHVHARVCLCVHFFLQSRIQRLPAYLVIQYMRFFVGRAGASDEVVAKKVLKVSPCHQGGPREAKTTWCW